MNNKNTIIKVEQKLTVKDLIITGVFIALIQICVIIGGIGFGITPILSFYLPIGAAILPGPIYLLLIAKVPKRGPIIIMGIISAIIGFMTGMHWAMCIGGLISSILADIIAGTKNYKSKRANLISYVMYCLGSTGTYIAFFINPDAWARAMLKNGTTQEYINSMRDAANWKTLVIMFIGTILVATISGIIGNKLLNKQFEKAGITA